MKTHQDLLNLYKQETGLIPQLNNIEGEDDFYPWVENKYLKLLNNKITEKIKLFKENPVSVEEFWGLINPPNSIDFDDDPDGTEETW